MKACDDTRVMVRPSLDDFTAPVLPRGYRLERLTHHAFAEWVGGLRGFALSHRQAHAERLQESPVPFHGFALLDPHARAVVCGQIALEAELIGVYEVFTAEDRRNAGLARLLCAQMLEIAGGLGAKTGYLQVDADELPARRVYRDAWVFRRLRVPLSVARIDRSSADAATPRDTFVPAGA